ncbi:hypothetical protein [Streptomyces sp. RerS4]|uniref:LppU/SCO3897 family protein n=1 Tax=Streptomyces sp. RerS4 TaxID=2942449 RepID=UPI00201C6C5D|nr:hypothetical protein [Streptomyces sp. RerS4]UQX01591.1 hypothetical protein M4D82_14525 [Streptomyces sp. RerS4]
MSSQEIALTLSPQEAATGVTIDIPLPTGSARLRIPPSRDGDLVRARVGDETVELRIRVSATAAGAAGTAATAATSAFAAPTPAPPTTPRPGKAGRIGCLVALALVAVVIAGAVITSGDDDTSDNAGSSSTATPSPTESSSPPYSTAPQPTVTTAPTPRPTPTRAPTSEPSYTFPPPVFPSLSEPSPYDRGTCLNGTLPDSTTPTRVNDVDEVPCSASDAHYKVIETFPGTSDMDRCESNSKTEYSFSARYTRGGVVTNEYVYCLVGLGSYAR